MAGFFGREAELDALHGLCVEARRRRTLSAGLVVGEPGSGKTRLLTEATRTGPIARSLSLAAFEPESNVPFGMGRDLLRALMEWPRSPKFPAPPPDTEVADPVARREAVHRALSSFDEILLVVDDVQWADAESLSLIHYLARGALADEYGLALILAGRPSPEFGSLSTSLESLLARTLIRIELKPLDRDAGISLLRSHDPSLDDRRAEELWRRSGGSPFWLEVLTRGADPDQNIDGLVASRLQGIGADAAALLIAVVLLAHPTPLDEAADVMAWPPDRVRDAVQALARIGLIVHEGATIRVAHDLIRDGVHNQTPEAERVRTHGLIAARLERNAGNDVSLLVAAAQHKSAARTDPVPVLRRILTSPQRRFIGQEGLAALAGMIEETPITDGSDQVALDVGVATLADELGQHGLALSWWSRSADRIDDPAGRARALLAASRAAHHLERTEQARSFLSRARDVRASDPILDVELEVADASILRWLEHRQDEAARLTHDALSSARALVADGDSGTLSPEARRAYLEALSLAAGDALQRNAIDDLLVLADEIVRVATGFDSRAYCEALLRTGVASLMASKLDDAEERLRLAWTEARKLVLTDLVTDIGHWLTRVRYLMGQLSDAEETAAECDAIASRLDDVTRPVAQVRVLRRVIQISRSGHIEAIEALREMAEQESDPHYRLEIDQRISTWLGRLHGVAASGEVHDRLDRARADGERAGCDRCLGDLLLAGAEALARVGDAESAAAWLRSRRDSSLGPILPRPLARAEASIAIVARDPDAASELERAGREAVATGMLLEAAWAQIDLGILLEDKDPAQAVSAFRSAVATAASAGALTEQRLAEQNLRRLGVRVWRRGRRTRSADLLDMLTKREREIVERVVKGEGNPEIAQALFLSRRTVERHVSNILGKLEIKNRTELAARLAPALAQERDLVAKSQSQQSPGRLTGKAGPPG